MKYKNSRTVEDNFANEIDSINKKVSSALDGEFNKYESQTYRARKMKERKTNLAPILTPNTNHELNFETSFDQKSGKGNHPLAGGYSTNNVSHIDHHLNGCLDSRSSPARTVVVNLGNTSPRRHNFAEISTINASTERT
jgi:hypothetical protein